jgi:hypothetical protein
MRSTVLKRAPTRSWSLLEDERCLYLAQLEPGLWTTSVLGVWLILYGTPLSIENMKKLAFTIFTFSMPPDIHMLTRTDRFFIDRTRAIAPASSA